MKYRLLKPLTLFTLAVAGISFGVSLNKEPTQVAAIQHISNYEDYYYTGNYYSGLDTTDSNGMQGDFRNSLTSLIYPKGFYTYSGVGETHLSTHLQGADEDPNNPANMIYFYTRDSVKKNPADSWNREHTWPQSLSKNNWGKTIAGTDILHIRPTYDGTNNSRGNLPFGNMNKSSPVYYSGMLYGYKGGYFEPIDSVKGDVARILMYVWTTYYDHYPNKINLLDVIQSYDLLMTWHIQDKPDALEGIRNNYSQTSKQKNRNPFVDRPEYAWKIFGEKVSSTVLNNAMETYPAEGLEPKTAVSLAISGSATKKDYFAGDAFDPTGLTITVTYDDSSTKVLSGSQVSWTPNPLTVGTTTVTANYGRLTATYSGITVVAKPTPEPGSNYSVEFKANGSDSGSELNGSVIMSSQLVSNTLIASITDTVKVFPGATGLKLGSSSVLGKLTLHLVEAAKNNVQSIKITAETYGSDSSQLAVKINGEEFETFVPNGEHEFELGNRLVNSITLEGVIKRVVIQKVEVVVTPPSIDLETISLNHTTANLFVGDTLQLTPTFTPNNASDKSVTWSSSNTSVATVNNDGLVTTIGVGNVRISVKNSDETVSAYCDITVQNRPASSSSSAPTSSANPDVSSSIPQTSEPTSSNPSSGSSTPIEDNKKGCNNFVGSTAALVGLVGFAVILLLKKKHQ